MYYAALGTLGNRMILQQARKLVVFVIGFTVVLFGIIMLITPGQGVLTILLGLAILATEFVWAKILLDRVKRQSQTAFRRVWPRKPVTATDCVSPPPKENAGKNPKSDL